MKKIDKKLWLALLLILTAIGIIFITTMIQKSILKSTFEVWAEQISKKIEQTEVQDEIEVKIEDLPVEVVEENTQEDSSKSNEKVPTNNGVPYYIKVNYGAQVVTIYGMDENKKYTKPIKAMVCSTGVATPTSGVYKIPARWKWLGLQGDVYGQYATQIIGNILFHSVPYLERRNPASLEYWEYDKLGTYASAGCIRLTVADALWIYNNCGKGTQVEFYSSSNPGPLGKPSAKKISSASENLRNWDPTDPDSDNPWKYNKPEPNPPPINTNKEVENKQNSEVVNKQTNTQTNIQVNEQVNKIPVNNQNKTNLQINTSVNTAVEGNKDNPMTSEIK